MCSNWKFRCFVCRLNPIRIRLHSKNPERCRGNDRRQANSQANRPHRSELHCFHIGLLDSWVSLSPKRPGGVPPKSGMISHLLERTRIAPHQAWTQKTISEKRSHFLGLCFSFVPHL